jgi:hypothetical protein
LSQSLSVFATAAIQHGSIRITREVGALVQPVVVTADMRRMHDCVVFDQANSD